jgi:hypothetical protein
MLAFLKLHFDTDWIFAAGDLDDTVPYYALQNQDCAARQETERQVSRSRNGQDTLDFLIDARIFTTYHEKNNLF